MKRVFLSLLIFGVFGAVANAQMLCQTNGATTICNGPLLSPGAPGINPINTSWGALFPQIAQQAAQQRLAEQQMALERSEQQTLEAEANQLAAQKREMAQRTRARARQKFLAQIAVASNRSLRAEARELHDLNCGGRTRCQQEADFRLRAIYAELRRRAAAPSHASSALWKKWRVLDEALADKIITPAQYEAQLSTLLQRGVPRGEK